METLSTVTMVRIKKKLLLAMLAASNTNVYNVGGIK